MKIKFLITGIMFLTVLGHLVAFPQAAKPLGKGQIMELVKAGMEGVELAKKIGELGIDFEPTDDYLQALHQAGAEEGVIRALRAARPKPLTREQVLQLVAGHVPSQRAVMLVIQHGIDFPIDDDYLQTLRVAGADDAVIAAVREASAAVTAELMVTTSLNAEIYWDGEPVGRADAQGELKVRSKLGTHALKVTLAGKKNYEQNITIASVQGAKVEARLEDAPGSIRLRTLASANVTLDGVNRGSANASGELALSGIPPGSHRLRVTAQDKKDYDQTVSVSAGQETAIQARLEDLIVRENPKDGLKYIWIPPGTFMMGCSPGDNQCSTWEKPSHRVTITKGFWLGQTLVTVGAYKHFAATTARQMPDAPTFNPSWANDNMPIVNVNWNDALQYCTWAGGRLPTEAEWEYAARAGSTEVRYGPVDEVAWYKANSSGQTHEVAQKRANGFGLFDMLGNVWEWVNDWYALNYYTVSPERDPRGPENGQDGWLRGGSWLNALPEGGIRVSARNGNDRGVRSIVYGLRCVGEGFAP